MDREIITKIIEAGNQAPSGGNSQPWKFKVQGNVIEVILFPEKDHPVMNFRNRGTFVALGALIENVVIEAQFLGFEATYEIFESNTGVRIVLNQSAETKNSDLVDIIPKRHSNRKPYKTDALTEAEKIYLFQEIDKFPDCELIVIEGEKISQAAMSVATDLLIFLQNKLLHQLLFKEVIWKEEEQKFRTGLYIKTLEMVPPKSFVFRLFKNWKMAQFFNKIKLTQKIYEETTATAASSGLFGAIVIKDTDNNFINAGRLLENIWLRASKLDLSFQLVSGMLFLWQQANFGNKDIFSEKEKRIINEAYKKLVDILGIKDKIIALTFRIGKSDKPLAVSYKRPPEIVWE